MPKSTKKKKDKAADFSKAKLKLGKGKQAPSNAVDTTFKARSIALPSQSIAHATDANVPSTRRRLTFEDLLSHLKHYNAGTRRDALFGLRELLEANPELIVTSLTSLLNGCVRVIGDEDASVRKALLNFLGWLFPRVPLEDLLPHAPTLLLFTASAQTHLFPEIRIDAVRFLDLLLQYIPNAVVDGWGSNSDGHGRRVLEGYLGILNAGTIFGEDGDTKPVQATSTASVILSSASKLVILKSLSTFLSTALSSRSSSPQQARQLSPIEPSATWFFASSFPSKSAFVNFDHQLYPVLSVPQRLTGTIFHEWVEQFEIENSDEDFIDDFTLAAGQTESAINFRDLSSAGQVLEDSGSSYDASVESGYIAQIARTMQPTLVSTFLDCAPSVFSPGSAPSEIELQSVVAVAEIARLLYGNFSSSTSVGMKDRSVVYNGVNVFLGHMSTYFPFSAQWSSTMKRDIKIEEAFQSLNLIFCELASLLMLKNAVQDQEDSSRHEETRPGKRNITKTPHILPVYVDHVRDYVLDVLKGKVSVSSNAHSTLPRPISSSVYMALLPTVWALISSDELQELDSDEVVLNTVIDHAMQASASSSVKRHTIGFLGRILLLGTMTGHPRVTRVITEPTTSKKLQEWLLHLPKILWELGFSDPPTTEVILRLLLRLSQRRSSVLDQGTSVSLSSRLVPYFIIQHPSRGELPGPFNKIPHSSPLRALALNVALSLASMQENDELDSAVRKAVSDEEKLYWSNLWSIRKNRSMSYLSTIPIQGS